MEILGIVNLTRDSFSDGGRFVDPDAAVAYARQLLADGADWVDIGAESTHPDAEDVPAEVEIERLEPVVQVLKATGARVSVDTYKPAVIERMLALGVDMINDVTALRDPAAREVLRGSDVPVVLMHSTATTARAERGDVAPDVVVGRVVAFFHARLAALATGGIHPQRLILDPGMGFFLGRDPRVSTTMLRHLNELAVIGRPVCVSTSRKSFIGALLADEDSPRVVDERGAGTLATELWAYTRGVQYVRTHDVRALRDAVRLWEAIAADTESE